MQRSRNTDDPGSSDERALTARSVVASILLGTRPPELPGRLLVRGAELFGIAEGTTRVALSRMVGAGELEIPADGVYRLAGRLLARQARQEDSRRPPLQSWDGEWVTAVVTAGGGRGAAQRAALRRALTSARLSELREGVWLRPDNLPRPTVLEQDGQCTWLVSRPADGDSRALAHGLWDLQAWSERAGGYLGRMDATVALLRDGDLTPLPRCFLLAAAALRHLTTDPLLPADLLPPGWNGDALRLAYEDYQAAIQDLLRTWFRSQEH